MQKKILATYIAYCTLVITGCNNEKKEMSPSTQETAYTEPAVAFDYKHLGVGNILIDSETTYKYKANFESRIRRFPAGIINDKVSKSVWFSADAIRLLAKYIDSTALKLDGVRIHLISYDSLNTAPGQYKPHQVSIVMVPTNPNKMDPKKHTDNWQVLKSEKNKADSILQKIGFLYGLNHGELCPQQCDTDQ